MNKHMLHSNILIFLARLDRKMGRFSFIAPLAYRWVAKTPSSKFGLRYYDFVVHTRQWSGEPYMTYKSACADLSRSLDEANRELEEVYKTLALVASVD